MLICSDDEDDKSIANKSKATVVRPIIANSQQLITAGNNISASSTNPLSSLAAGVKVSAR